MSTNIEQWQSTLYGLIRNPTEASLLMLSGEAGWTLPQAQIASRIWFLHLGWVSQAMREKLGLDVTALRYLHFETDEAKQQVEGVYILESHQPALDPPLNGTWVNRATLANLSRVQPHQAAIIDAYLTELETKQVPPERAAWGHEGWYTQVQGWVEAVLSQQNIQIKKPLEQIRVWGVSCVLRAQTTEGDYYFKMGGNFPYFANEPKLMVALATRFPDSVPMPIAVDLERRWLLLPDIGEPFWAATDDDLVEAFCRIGQMQVDLAGQMDNLVAMGCVNRDLDYLLGQIEAFISNVAGMSGLESSEIERLKALIPDLKDKCHRLNTFKLPTTLVHGDLYKGNLANKDGQTLIFDWAEGCIAHPFFDMLEVYLEKEVNLQTRIRDAYLALWTDFEPMNRLLEAWKLAEPLCALHIAMSAHSIVTHLEPVNKSQLAHNITRWLRVLFQIQATK